MKTGLLNHKSHPYLFYDWPGMRDIKENQLSVLETILKSAFAEPQAVSENWTLWTLWGLNTWSKQHQC